MSRTPRKTPPAPGGAVRPLIEIGGDLAQMTDRAWSVLRRTNNPTTVFRYAGTIARIEHDDRDVPMIRVLDLDRLRHLMARRARWVNRKDRDVVDVHPPLAVIRDMLASPEPPLPVLRHLVHGPIAAPDGTLHLRPGYDPRTRAIYMCQPGFVLRRLPDSPTAVDIQRATAIIREAVCDFPFASRAEFAHAVALLLLPFVQALIDGPLPLHIIDKPMPGAGAGLLTDVLLWPAFGRVLSKMTEGRDEDEWRKRITSVYLSGLLVVIIDNLRLVLDSAAVASAITEDVWTDRLLGRSQMVELPSRRVWVGTGNNVQLSDEMRRRCVRIRLDPAMERPEARTDFRHPRLMSWVAEHRADLVWGALVITRGWLLEGRPAGSVIMGRFEAWCRVIGGLLDVAGIPGFLENLPDQLESMDATSTAWAALIELWWHEFQSREVTSGELWPIVFWKPDMKEGLGLGTGNEESQKTRFGQQLVKMRDRVFDGRRVLAAGRLHGARRWKLSPIG